MHLKAAIALAVASLAANAAQLTVDQALLTPGKTADVNVRLSAGDAAPTGLQFDLGYESAALEIKVEAGPIAIEAGKSVQSAAQPGKQRVLIIGFNKNSMSDGIVAVLHVSLKTPGEAGKVYPLHITAASGTNQRAETLPVTGNDGSVKVEMGRKDQ